LEGLLVTGLTIAICGSLFIFAGLVAGLLWCSSLCSARTLEQRCGSELRQLKSLLSNRHLIVSHLADSIPAKLDGLFERRRFEEQLLSAEKGLQALDADNPDLDDLRAVQWNEQSLAELINELVESLEATDAATQIQTVAGCMTGLEKKTSEIRDALATYNAAAITYSSFLGSSLVARLKRLPCRFEVLDLEPPGGSVSGDSGRFGDSGLFGDPVAP
jgi:hypothetical protein